MRTYWRPAVAIDLLLALGAFLIDGFGSSGTTTTFGPVLPEFVIVLLTGCAALTLLVRRRHPLVPFAAWWVLGLLPLLVVGHEQVAGLFVAVVTVASYRGRRTALAATVASVLPLQLNAWDVYRQQASEFSVGGVLLLVLVWLLLPAAAYGIGIILFRLRERLDLQERLNEADLQSAIRDERLRLARDLHDIVAHSVSAMILQAAGARSLSEETDIRIRTALRSVELTGADAMKELHRLLGLLRESSSHAAPDLLAQPGLENIDQILATTRACGVEVELVETGVPHKLDTEVSYTAFRMVQECMANVIKHGGAGARSTVDIDWHDDGLDITVRNDEHDAVSASMLSGGYGLRGLTERVAEVGGQFAAGPAEESIFVASMSLPFRLAAAPASGG